MGGLDGCITFFILAFRPMQHSCGTIEVIAIRNCSADPCCKDGSVAGAMVSSWVRAISVFVAIRFLIHGTLLVPMTGARRVLGQKGLTPHINPVILLPVAGSPETSRPDLQAVELPTG